MDDKLRQRAHEHGVAIYADRLILNPQPPIDASVVSDIERRCAGPIPQELVDLWNVAFGGELDYCFQTQLGGQIVDVSFTELFYPGSDAYHDLWGWIDHELELAKQAALERGAKFDGRLRFLPFGGFEYAERLYVCLEPGPDYGSVHAWVQGLPPAWVLRLNEDRVGRVADSVADLFARLDLEDDPFLESGESSRAGLQMAETIDGIAQADSELSSELEILVRQSVVCWRSELAGGKLPTTLRGQRLALADAVSNEGRPALDRLQELGGDLTLQLRGGGNALDLALAIGKPELAEFLIAQNVDTTNSIKSGARNNPPDLIQRLLELGAMPDPIAARSAALAGLAESAEIIASALSSSARAEMLKTLDPDKFQEKWKQIETLRDACLRMQNRPH